MKMPILSAKYIFW